MKINIYGSTGEIGKKTLFLINKNFPKLNVNLLCANSNVNLITKQIDIFKPKYVYLSDQKASEKLKSIINSKSKVLSFKELCNYLKISQSDFSILAISGYKSLYFLEHIISN